MEKITGLQSDDVFLSSVRNAFVLLVAGITLLVFGGRLLKIGLAVLILVLLLLISALYSYWRRIGCFTTINFTPYVVIITIGVLIWLIHDTFLELRKSQEKK